MKTLPTLQMELRSRSLADLCSGQAIVFLVLIAELLALILTLVRFGLPEFNWEAFALTSLYLLWSVLLSAALICQASKRVSAISPQMAAFGAYSIILVVFFVVSVLAQWLLNGVFLGRGEWALDGWALLVNALVVAVLGGIAVRYFYLAERLRAQQQAELQARIEALQARIRPHFLFNSMNSIASLISTDPEAAETAVEDLSVLFRASLAELRTQSTLEDERQLCEAYLRIEHFRLGERLRVRWDIDSLPALLPLPPLTLQPLLENAIYHGIQSLPEGGEISIQGQQSGGVVEISVENPLPSSIAPSGHEGLHLAQENIRLRLQAIFGESADLKNATVGGLYRTTLSYPAELI